MTALVASGKQAATPHLGAQGVAVDIECGGRLALVAVVLLQYLAQEMGLELMPSLIQTDAARHHFSDQRLESGVQVRPLHPAAAPLPGTGAAARR